MKRSAIFSGDHRYRYKLSRYWADGNALFFIMLNPSTANENTDDPTIRRCVGFGKHWGYAGIEVLNLFALVSNEPHKLVTEADSVGLDNDRYLKDAARCADKVIVAWGNFVLRLNLCARRKEVLEILKDREIYCLGETEQGQPRHPLYVPEFQPLEVYKIL